MRSKSDITEKWKNETINQANALAEREAIYRRGFGDGHKEAREYAQKLIRDEVWQYHKLSPEFLKQYNIGIDEEKDINELLMKAHNEVLEDIIKKL